MNPVLYGPDNKPIDKRKSRIVHPKKPDTEDDFISRCVALGSGDATPIPMIYEGRFIGWTVGEQHSRRVTFVRKPAWYKFTVGVYDDVITACGLGQRYPSFWNKAMTSAPVANNWYDTWPVAGNPPAGAYGGTALTAKQHTDTEVGALYHGGNVSTLKKYLTGVTGFSVAGTPTYMLGDRVITYEACPFNAAVSTAFTNTLTAQRYVSAGQSGMKIVCTCQTVFGATASNITALSYTNNAGTASQAMPTTTTVAIIVSAAAPTATLGARCVAPSNTAATLTWGLPFLPLANGDGGVRLIDHWTTSAANTGTLCIILYRPLFWWGVGQAGVASQVDAVFQYSGMEQIFDGACLNFLAFFPAATAPTSMFGDAEFLWN